MLKCPKCRRWNRAALPRCQYCGTPLAPADGYNSPASPAWQSELKDEPTHYVLVDESGETETKAEYRDTLADEMVSFAPPKTGGRAAPEGTALAGRQKRALRLHRVRCAPPATAARFFPSCRTIPTATFRPVDSRLVEDGSPVSSGAKRVRRPRFSRLAISPAAEN